MHVNINAPAPITKGQGRIGIEIGMLELFAPPDHVLSGNAASRPPDRAPLWRADAIHRAKNLAQLTTSIAVLAEHPSRLWLPEDVVAETPGLARAYDELGTERDPGQAMPCVPLLTEITTRLVMIFGRARGISVLIDARPLSLPPDMRRALVLMCSEMTINALKYGYHAGRGGRIDVRLAAGSNEFALIVEDDGAGSVDSYAPGHGGSLIDQLGTILGAVVTRGRGRDGVGYRVCVTGPVVRG